MLRKRQNERERLILKDAKFEASKPCELCGQPTKTASVRCLACLEKSFLTEELAYARECLRRQPQLLVELAHDARKRIHLVLLHHHARNTAWCGTEVTQKKDKRQRLDRTMFPVGICEGCLEIYEGMVAAL